MSMLIIYKIRKQKLLNQPQSWFTVNSSPSQLTPKANLILALTLCHTPILTLTLALTLTLTLTSSDELSVGRLNLETSCLPPAILISYLIHRWVFVKKRRQWKYASKICAETVTEMQSQCSTHGKSAWNCLQQAIIVTTLITHMLNSRLNQCCSKLSWLRPTYQDLKFQRITCKLLFSCS